MELRNLRHVVVLARKLSYSRAAEELGLSQSALTRSIQSIERQANVRLFDRDRGGVRLTPLGRIFVDRAEAVLDGVDDLQNIMQRSASAESGEVSFGMAPLPARALLPSVLSESLGSSPNLRCHVVIRNIETLWQLLIAGQIEFFISAEGRVPAAPSARITRLGWFPLSLLVRPGHPALQEAESGSHYPVLVAGEAGQLDHVSPELKALIAGPRHIIEDYDTLAKVTERSDAIWISSTVAVLEELADGRIQEIVLNEGRENRRMRIVMYSLERRSLSPGALKLRQGFQRQMRLLMQG